MPTNLKGSSRKRRQAAYITHEKALKLRLAGATYEQIAKSVGYTAKGAAYKAVESAMADSKREKADQILEIELMRLDTLQRAVWPAAVGGDRKAILTALQVMNRRAKYLSLDNPEQTDLVKSGVDLLRTLAEQIGAEGS